MPQVKKSDNKGRFLLGAEYADSSFEMEIKKGKNGEKFIILRPVERITVPLNEAWLFKNKETLKSVKAGLTQAHEEKFADDPRAGKNKDWLDEDEG